MATLRPRFLEENEREYRYSEIIRRKRSLAFPLCIPRREIRGNGILRIPFGISTYDFPPAGKVPRTM